MKLKPLFYKQETRYSCVPACLRIVLSAYSIYIPESELRKLCDCTPFGTNALNAVDALRQLGFPKTAKHNLTTDELDAVIANEIYPVVFIDLSPIDGIRNAHAVVIIETDQVQMRVYDPLQGERLIPRDTFLQAWALMHNMTILIKK